MKKKSIVVKTDRYDLRLGDSRDVLKTLAENSLDSCVCDPPYSLTSIVKRFGKASSDDNTQTSDRADGYARAASGFMGCTWDTGEVVFDSGFWAEVLRVLKPGGYLLGFSGTRSYHRLAVAIEDAGFEIRDQIGWTFGQGFPKSHDAGDGRGTALKPAWEPICMARKPLIGTVAQNIAAWGTGAINIDVCRIETNDNLNGGAYAKVGGRVSEAWIADRSEAGAGMFAPGKTVGRDFVQSSGRWPANLIHDGSDEVLALFPHTKSGDEGSAARFFYCAKASRTDREEGCEYLTGVGEISRHKRKNNHPTVKPTELMRYLCRLVTPPGGLVIDPFLGSGSTGKAAMLEGFRFIGIELEPTYMEIAAARVEFGARMSVDNSRKHVVTQERMDQCREEKEMVVAQRKNGSAS